VLCWRPGIAWRQFFSKLADITVSIGTILSTSSVCSAGYLRKEWKEMPNPWCILKLWSWFKTPLEAQEAS
jgi:hypothetical protein